MKRIIQRIVSTVCMSSVLGSTCILTGCAGSVPYQYRFQPLSVPNQAESVEAGVVPSTAGFNLFIDNKSDMTVQVLWDRCVYVDAEGFSHRLMHSGVKLIAKEQPQLPTAVAPHSRIEDFLIPSDYVKWIGSEWESRPLFPTGTRTAMGFGDTYLLYFPGIAHPESYRGKEFGVTIALETGQKPPGF